MNFGAWVPQRFLLRKDSINSIFLKSKKINLKRLYFQVLNDGKSLYKSNNFVFNDETVDLFEYILDKGRKDNIKVIPWFNINFVKTFGNPIEKDHILNLHPEWVTYDEKGNKMLDYKDSDINELFGYFLDPGLEEVRNYYSKALNEFTERYEVKEIHLDFLRYPYKNFGFHPSVRQDFYESEMENFFDYRKEMITEEMKLFRNVSKKNEFKLSVATYIPYKKEAYENRIQPWKEWFNRDLFDYSVVMIYAGNIREISRLINSLEKENIQKNYLRIGLGAFKFNEKNINELKKIIDKLKDNDFHQIDFFHINSLFYLGKIF